MVFAAFWLKEKFFWPLTPQIFFIDLCFTILDPDPANFWSIEAKNQEKRAKMRGLEKPRFRIYHTEIFCSNWFHAFLDSYGKDIAHKNPGTKNKILQNRFYKIRAPLFFFSFFSPILFVKQVFFGPWRSYHSKFFAISWFWIQLGLFFDPW